MFDSLPMVMQNAMSPDVGDQMNAAALFERINGRNHLRAFLNRILGRCNCLVNLSTVATEAAQRTFAGLRLVPIDQIRGTEGRHKDFDADFNPLQEHDKQRWMGVLIAMSHGAFLPPVELIQVGDIYFVRDGHHRISAARQLGLREIEAEVTVWEQKGETGS